MTGIIRVEFDATLDEFVDVNLRLAYRTNAFRQQRWRSAAAFGASFAIVLGLMTVSEAGRFSPMIAMAAIGAGAVSGSLFGWWYGSYYDSYVRRHTRRMLKEMFRGAEEMRCEMELRPEGLWSKSFDTEIILSWKRLREIVDAEHGIELWFDPGLALIRSRAFDNPELRQLFIKRVRELAPPMAVATSDAS
jgi:hypothetical protein